MEVNFMFQSIYSFLMLSCIWHTMMRENLLEEAKIIEYCI